MSKTEPLKIKSRLLLGTGKFGDETTQTKAIGVAEANVLTSIIRHVNSYDKNLPNSLADISLKDFTTLPNAADAKTAEEVIHIAEIARHVGVCNMIKAEVIGDDKTLLSDPFEAYEACKVLLGKDYIIRSYVSNDVILTERLEELGVHAVMPFASPIGTGHGINNQLNLSYIIRHSDIPVIIDAGIGSLKGTCHTMELGTDATLLNTAVSGTEDPVEMAEAMRLGIHAGHLSYKAGRIPVKHAAQASSPTEGLRSL